MAFFPLSPPPHFSPLLPVCCLPTLGATYIRVSAELKENPSVWKDKQKAPEKRP